ncbi:MAG: aldehyde dehydrogenase family protein, partial [Terriglobia bacterium]
MASQPTPIAPVAANPKMQSLNPATGELLAEFDPMGADQVRSLVDRARYAAPAWSSLERAKRAHYLLALKDVIYARREKLANLIALEAGKPLAEVWAAEIQVVLDAAQYFARHAAEFLAAQSVPHHNLAVRLKRGRLEYEPYGVIGIFSPANYPLSIPFGDIIPALIAGNTVVLKPSELVPQIGRAIGELFEYADFPPGVVSVAWGAGEAG